MTALRVYVSAIKTFIGVMTFAGGAAAMFIAAGVLAGTLHPEQTVERDAFLIALAGLGIMKVGDLASAGLTWLVRPKHGEAK